MPIHIGQLSIETVILILTSNGVVVVIQAIQNEDEQWSGRGYPSDSERSGFSNIRTSGDAYTYRAAFNRNSNSYPDEQWSGRGYPSDSERSRFSSIQASRIGNREAERCAERTFSSNARQSSPRLVLSDVETNSSSSSLQSDLNRALRVSALSRDDEASLRIIRSFAYLHGNKNTERFRPLQEVLNALKIKSAEYWIPLIETHLPEVGIDKLNNTV
ncbi:hypothetical protein KIN20_033341 [Parelaphostrongylus tenuis]|uniref:Uncharacterized protein n=1 Tax=Parelaphostrongylus tenuis TaxID=148309 RepID=A0AAD5WIP9_PARTN|nr:hypothetical protein KIN20_033341 [Parelaphostrongylus tenuis]